MYWSYASDFLCLYCMNISSYVTVVYIGEYSHVNAKALTNTNIHECIKKKTHTQYTHTYIHRKTRIHPSVHLRPHIHTYSYTYINSIHSKHQETF